MSSRQILVLVLIIVVVVLGYTSLFTVNERELAIKFRLGEIVKSDYKPK